MLLLPLQRGWCGKRLPVGDGEVLCAPHCPTTVFFEPACISPGIISIAPFNPYPNLIEHIRQPFAHGYPLRGQLRFEVGNALFGLCQRIRLGLTPCCVLVLSCHHSPSPAPAHGRRRGRRVICTPDK